MIDPRVAFEAPGRSRRIRRATCRVNSEKLWLVLTHPGFIELSQWPDLREPWAVGMRLGSGHRITWVHGSSMEEALQRAARGIEMLSTEAA